VARREYSEEFRKDGLKTKLTDKQYAKKIKYLSLIILLKDILATLKSIKKILC